MDILIIVSFAMVCILWFVLNIFITFVRFIGEPNKLKWYKFIAVALAYFFVGFIIAPALIIKYANGTKALEKQEAEELRRKKCA